MLVVVGIGINAHRTHDGKNQSSSLTGAVHGGFVKTSGSKTKATNQPHPCLDDGIQPIGGAMADFFFFFASGKGEAMNCRCCYNTPCTKPTTHTHTTPQQPSLALFSAPLHSHSPWQSWCRPAKKSACSQTCPGRSSSTSRPANAMPARPRPGPSKTSSSRAPP